MAQAGRALPVLQRAHFSALSDRRGHHGAHRASGVLPDWRPPPTRTVAAPPREHTASLSEWSPDERLAFRTWLRRYAEAADSDSQAQAQEHLVDLILAEHRLFRRFEVQVSDAGLTATAWGEALDRARHELNHEVKAITYHGLTVQRDGDGWMAEVIVDI